MIEILDWWNVLNNFDFGILNRNWNMVYGNEVWIELHNIRSTIRVWSVLWDMSIDSFIGNIYRTYLNIVFSLWMKEKICRGNTIIKQLLPYTTKAIEMLVIKKKNILPPNTNYISLLTIKKSAGKYLWCKEEEVWFQPELIDELPWLTCNKENTIKLVTHETISKLS